jgi:DMSO/TMAO reductase YedYZ molybdopterin-dependent catalytic subunit
MSQLAHQSASKSKIERRAFLVGAAAAPLVLGTPLIGWSAPQQQPGLIERVRDPQNLEFPFHTLDNAIVPNERFYVRNHFPEPRLDPRTWRLRVEGAVTRELELSLDQIRSLPSRTLTATLECAGNSRALNVPPLRGVSWQQGAVGNAEWTGVPLAAVLKRAGLRDAAVEVVLVGADRGEVAAEPRPNGPIAFARSLPLAKAQQDNVLLAYRMNGDELPPAHGFPLRTVVSGWYGMASVKWLTRLIVTDAPFQGFWQTAEYTYFEQVRGLPVLRPITELQVKSLIAAPRPGDRVAPGAMVRIHGAAWTGESEITRVEISADAGRTWSDARLQGQAQRYSWRLWEQSWRAPNQAGRVTLMSRATDARGRVQPATRDPNRRNYMVSHVLPVEIEVR